MRRIGANKFSVNQVKFQPQTIESAPENSVGRLRLLICVRPRINQRADRFESC
jgi:hypothetical protein